MSERIGKKDWWRHSVLYHLYPRSYKDSNGDGIGDIQGIISKLDHLKDIGVTAAWLSPIYKGPGIDTGYDISDYYDIQEEYGTLQDFDELIAKAKELNIKILMDLVLNHTSDQHEWFKKSENCEEGYEDYFVWKYGRDGNKSPPNNWNSVFNYSAWEFSKKRQLWYLHQFTVQQPDLNFENAKVIQEMKDIMTFWFKRGVAGFRIDAAPHIFETGLEDEPPSGKKHLQRYEYDYLSHIYTKDQPQNFDLIYEFRSYIDDYNEQHKDEDERIIMTEAYVCITSTMKYYGNAERLGVHISFNFELVNVNLGCTARDITMIIKTWLNYMPWQYVPNWVIGNHDNPRVASRVGKENANGFNMLIAILPGIINTYYGEEIGMEDGFVSCLEGDDPKAPRDCQKKFEAVSRDFERTPFHWDGTHNAGFSTAHKTWLPVSDKYLVNNLAQQKMDPYSHYNIYKKLNTLRETSYVLQTGKTQVEPYSDDIILVKRNCTLEKAIILLFNFGNKYEVVDLTKIFEPLWPELKVLISLREITPIHRSNKINLEPHECIIFEELFI